MWSFLKRNVWLSLLFAFLLYALNHFFPVDNVRESWWWTLVLPNAMISIMAYRENNRAKAEHSVIMDAISERLCVGRLTEPERRLALRFYGQLREKIYDTVIRSGSFHVGESLHLVLQRGQEEVRGVLSKLHRAPWDVPELTRDEERVLAGLAADNPGCAKVVVKWLFAGGADIENLQRDGVLQVDDAAVSQYMLDWLPELSGQTYSNAVAYLTARKQHVKGRIDALRELQQRLLRCEAQDFDDTVAVIGGINCGLGQEALDGGIRKLLRIEKEKGQEKRKRVDREMAALIAAASTC